MAFPFFSLPADIRVEIYTALLGDKTIHFNDHFPQLGNGGLFLCQARPPDNQFLEGDKKRSTIFKKLGQYDDEKLLQRRHFKCFCGWEGLQLQFLLTCLQVYREASHIPFKDNQFTFPSAEMVERFIKRLKPWQTASIQSIALYQQNALRYWSYPRLWPEKHSLMKWKVNPFAGLKHVKIFVELTPDDISPARNSGTLDLTFFEYCQDDVLRLMGCLGSKRLRTLEIIIVDACPVYGITWHFPSEKQGEAWIEKIRAMITRMPALQ